MNNRYVITFDFIKKNVRESSEEKPSISTEEIAFIHNRLVNAVYELDRMNLPGSVSIEELKVHDFDLKISKKPQEEVTSEGDEILEEMIGTSYQLSISNKNLMSSVAQKIYDLKEQATVILYQETSSIDSIKQGVEKFLDRLLTNLCDTFGFQFKDKHSNLYQVDMTLTSQGKENFKEQSSGNFQKLVECLVDGSLVSSIDNEWKYLSPEGNKGFCIDGPIIESDSTCGNFHTKVSTTTQLSM